VGFFTLVTVIFSRHSNISHSYIQLLNYILSEYFWLVVSIEFHYTSIRSIIQYKWPGENLTNWNGGAAQAQTPKLLRLMKHPEWIRTTRLDSYKAQILVPSLTKNYHCTYTPLHNQKRCSHDTPKNKLWLQVQWILGLTIAWEIQDTITIIILRHYCFNSDCKQLYIFADASPKAYDGAVAYLTAGNCRWVNLIVA